MDPSTLLDKYRGVLGLTGALAKGMGKQALSGYSGINELIAGHGIDKAVDAIDRMQSDETRPDDATIGVIKDIAPAYRAISEHLSPITSAVGNAYQGSVDHYADLAGKYVSPQAGGEVAALGAAAPQAIFPEGRESNAMLDALKQLPEEMPRAISSLPGDASHLAGKVPDNATVYASRDPDTGALHGHAVVVPRNGGMQLVDTYVNPQYQGAGIGTDILKSAAHDAHEAGVPLHSDTSVSPAHMASAQKSGLLMQLNPNVAEGENPKYGTSLNSTDGRPVFTMPPPTSADEAHVDDPLPGMYAEGGEAAPAVNTLASLVAKYAPKETLPPSDYVTNLMEFAKGNHPALNNEHGYPNTYYHGTPVFTARNGAQLGDVQSFDPSAVQAVNKGVRIVQKPDGTSFQRSITPKPKFDSFGSWFSSNPGDKGAGMFAGSDGAIYPVHLSIKNPYQPQTFHEMMDLYDKVSPGLPKDPAKFKQYLIDQGHDGVLFPQGSYDGGDHSMAVALYPEQVKSAVGNVGSFDATDPDITKATGGPIHMADGGTVVGGLAGLGKLIAEYAPERLRGLPNKATIRGVGTIDVGPNPVARAAAADYMQQAGIKTPPQLQYVQADPERGARIAAAFDAMPHAPDDPKVAASYQAMINETLAQYQAMKKAGVNVEFMPQGQDPYAASPRLMAEDLRANNHMYVYPTDAGFGSAGEDVSGNPLLGQSGESFGGVPATHNDLFRAVHDYFGHAKEGVGFRANGEENAWQQHARMYSDLARPAMTAETRGQNSWVNFGPHGEYNQTASGADTIYAPQKTGLLPDEFNQVDDPDMHFLHMGNPDQAQVTLDPKFMGRGIKGAEARRGGPKVTSLYPWDIDPTQIEQGLESKTPYHVSIPKSQMYDMSADPEGHLANADSFSDAEQAVKDAGYAGYHVPQADGILRGQARVFQPVQASRIGPGAATPEEEDLASGFARGGAVRRFADGGGAELAPALDTLSGLVKQYAPEAEHLAQAVADKGTVTYNPTSGDIHTNGYAVLTPTTAERAQALDHAPSPEDFHQYMMDHQDAFDEDPKAAIHVASDPRGFHLMSVIHHEPDMERAHIYGSLNDASQFHDIAGNENIPVNHEPYGFSEPSPDAPTPEETEAYLANPKMARDPTSTSPRQDAIDAPMIRTPWTQGQQTVSGARRNAFPGIYGDPRQVVADATEKVAPEDPLMRRLFGVSRADLSDAALSRQGNELGVLPGAKANPRGALSALGVMTPHNTQRLVDVLAEARNSPSLFQGMTGWYNMDPLYQHFERIWGDQAPEKYRQFNTLSGMASPGSDVGTEIARGSAANWLHNEGRFADFVRYGGGVESPEYRSAPADLADLPGHVYHRTAQAIPMSQYLESGSMQMKSPKVPAYIQASGVPQTGFQTDLPVGDAHWARGVGLADTRGDATLKGKPVIPGSSVSTPEMQTLHPWWRDQVAAQAGLDSVPAQALAWGTFSPITGVKSAIGAPKLEIMATQIGKLANRLGISPEDARDLVVSGKAGAFADGGEVTADGT